MKLFRVCREQSLTLARLKEAIAQDPHAAAKLDDDNESLPLHALCANDDATPEMLRALLEAGPPSACTTRNMYGRVGLHVLCANENVSLALVRELLNHTTEAAMVTCHDGGLPLHDLCRNFCAQWDAVKAVCSANEDAVTVRDSAGDTPLLILKQAGNVRVMTLLEQRTQRRLLATPTPTVQVESDSSDSGDSKGSDGDDSDSSEGESDASEVEDEGPAKTVHPKSPSPRQLAQKIEKKASPRAMRSQLEQAMADADTKRSEIQMRQARLMDLKSELQYLNLLQTSINSMQAGAGHA